MLAEKAGAELRKRMLAAKRLGIMLNYSDGKCIARNSEVNPASANDIFLFKTARLALTKAWTRRVRIRHLRLVCDHLTRAWSQRGLFFDRDEEKTQNLVSTVDKIRRRFGRTAIRIGRTIQVSPL
jgi:DNA polymerase-4